MQLEELLKEHPKTAIVVKQWLLNKLLESINDSSIPEDFKEYARQQGITDDKVAGILNGSPRALFDIFDGHKIYVEISHEITGFWWKIKDDKNFIRLGNDPYPTRKEADTEAIIESFKLLEDKL
jgi:hypothetical protein